MTTTLREARDAYWKANGFGPDGGASLRWVPAKVFGVKVYFLNSDARRRALRFHDLHHVVAGYGTDLIGEAEMGAWELATGCRRVPIALLLNLVAVALGSLRAPRRVRAAWTRGRACRNLYATTYDDQLLARTVGDVQHELGLDAAFSEEK